MLTTLSPGPTVDAVMTRMPVVVVEGDGIAGVAELLVEYEITGLPVVDATDRLVGVISQTDLVRLRGSAIPRSGWHGLIVRDLMTTPAKTIQAWEALDEAARRMTAEHIHRLVVVDRRDRPPRGHHRRRHPPRDRRLLRGRLRTSALVVSADDRPDRCPVKTDASCCQTDGT